MAEKKPESREQYRKTIRFSEKSYQVIEKVKKEQGLATFSEAVTFLTEFYEASSGKEAQREKAITRIRLASNGADVSAQMIMEILNSLCYAFQVRDFIGTEQMEHPVVTEARQSVKNRIARYKQRKDWKKEGEV